MKKTLYFEGAGCTGTQVNDVENCRIRTAFTNKDGEKIYIELSPGYKYTKVEYGKNGKKLKNPKWTSEDGYLYCDFCRYITEDSEIDDRNDSRLPCERNTEMEWVKYTKENILAFVNENCNADFTEIVVLDNLAGFRVNADGKRNTPEAYNYGDTFNYNADLTRRRREKVEEMKKEFCKLFNQKHDNTSYWVDKDGNLVVRINTYDEALRKANWTKGRQFIVEV